MTVSTTEFGALSFVKFKACSLFLLSSLLISFFLIGRRGEISVAVRFGYNIKFYDNNLELLKTLHIANGTYVLAAVTCGIRHRLQQAIK
jgi:hypothetical protein